MKKKLKESEKQAILEVADSEEMILFLVACVRGNTINYN